MYLYFAIESTSIVILLSSILKISANINAVIIVIESIRQIMTISCCYKFYQEYDLDCKIASFHGLSATFLFVSRLHCKIARNQDH